MNSKPTIIFDPYPRNEEMVFTSDVEKELNQISKLILHFGSRAPNDLVEENPISPVYCLDSNWYDVDTPKELNMLNTIIKENHYY